MKRQMLDEKIEDLVYLTRLDHVVVIEDEKDPAGEGGDLVDQRGQKSLDRRRLKGLEGAQESLSNADLCGL